MEFLSPSPISSNDRLPEERCNFNKPLPLHSAFVGDDPEEEDEEEEEEEDAFDEEDDDEVEEEDDDLLLHSTTVDLQDNGGDADDKSSTTGCGAVGGGGEGDGGNHQYRHPSTQHHDKRDSQNNREDKVHWGREASHALLDCVERWKDDLIHKTNHNHVWEAVGKEMEDFCYNRKHCTTKWKNLRRDVRQHVTNPTKHVRNLDVLKRAAALIGEIYGDDVRQGAHIHTSVRKRSTPTGGGVSTLPQQHHHLTASTDLFSFMPLLTSKDEECTPPQQVLQSSESPASGTQQQSTVAVTTTGSTQSKRKRVKLEPSMHKSSDSTAAIASSLHSIFHHHQSELNSIAAQQEPAMVPPSSVDAALATSADGHTNTAISSSSTSTTTTANLLHNFLDIQSNSNLMLPPNLMPNLLANLLNAMHRPSSPRELLLSSFLHDDAVDGLRHLQDTTTGVGATVGAFLHHNGEEDSRSWLDPEEIRQKLDACLEVRRRTLESIRTSLFELMQVDKEERVLLKQLFDSISSATNRFSC